MSSFDITIDAALSRFRKTRRPSALFQTVGLIIRKKRVLETAYGAYQFLTSRPGVLNTECDDDLQDLLEEAETLYRETRIRRLHLVYGEANALNPPVPDFNFRYHGFCFIEGGFLAGEYRESEPRLIMKTAKGCFVKGFYDDDPDVRHIHALHCDGEHVYITTGDSSKYLDRYLYVDGELAFDRRLMRILGGFSASCTVANDIYFGTDFSGRPNYILNFRTRMKAFLPGPAYLQFCELMLPLRDRYIYCRSKNLAEEWNATIFDTHRNVFVHCEKLLVGWKPVLEE